MTTNIDITIQGQKRPPEDDNWPLIIEDEDQILTSFSLFLFDGATKRDPEDATAWIDVPEWFRSSEEQMVEIWNWTDNETFKGAVQPFHVVPKNVEIKIFANEDSRVPADVIAAEFGTGNPNRWDRKPLAPVLNNTDDEDANTAHQWVTGGTVLVAGNPDSSHGVYNIYVELVQSTGRDPFAHCNLDEFKDGTHKKIRPKRTEGEASSYPDLGFRSSPIRKKFGIRISEKGSKAVCHYSDGHDDTKYTREWIEGLHWCPFDTMDSTNFKVTQEPSFEAAEVNGNFMGDGKWYGYLMPRSVAYYVRYRHHVKTEDTEVQVFTNTDCSYTLLDLGKPWNVNIPVDAWTATNFNATSCVVHGGKYWVTESAGASDEPGNETPAAGYYQCWHEVTYAEVLAHSDHNVDALMDCSVVHSTVGGDEIDTVTAYVWNSTHYIGIFWGRLPHDFQEDFLITNIASSGRQSTTEVRFYTDGDIDDYLGSVEYPWFETRDEARSSWVDAGGSLSEVESVVLCGSNTTELHLHRDAANESIRIVSASDLKECKLDQIRNTVHLSPVDASDLDAVYGYYGLIYGGVSALQQHCGCYRLWQVIEDSDFWQNVIAPLRDAALAWEDNATPGSMIDCIPYGVALSPSMAGDLVGILRKGQRAYFIWRRTDEDLDALMVVDGDSDNTGHCSFESNRLDGATEHFSEPSYWVKEPDFVVQPLWHAYGAEYADQFTGDVSSNTDEWVGETYYGVGDKVQHGGIHYKCAIAHTSEATWSLTELEKWSSMGTGSRKLTHVGRPISLELFTDSEHLCADIEYGRAFCQDDGQVALAAPIYLLVSKERAMLDHTTWLNNEDSTLYIGKPEMWGASVDARNRCARNVIETRDVRPYRIEATWRNTY